MARACDLSRSRTGDAVYSRLREAIERGELSPGQLVASTRALRAQLGVSYHAVLSGLRRLEAEGWIMRRRGAGTFVCDPKLNGKPRPFAKQVALLLSPHVERSQFLRPLVNAIREEIEKYGGKRVEQVVEMASRNECSFGKLEADVALWVCPSAPYVLSLPPKPPFVLVAQDCESISPRESGYDIVTSDSRQGAALAGKYLREIGCKQVVFLGVGERGDWDVNSRLRLEGFELGWGARLSERECVRLKNYTSMSGLEAAAEFFLNGHRLEGVFAASDDIAMGFCHGAVAHAVKLGKELKLVGFDGQPPRFEGDPALTTVAVPLELMGRVAARMALERAERPDMPMRRLCLGCSLKRGDTA